MSDKKNISSDCTEKEKATCFYCKLWKCLKKALANEDELGCHCNQIIVHLGKSVESGFTYYDSLADGWCDYFLRS